MTTEPSASAAAGHVVLLGDSVFDNGAYVPGHPDVVAQLRGALGPAWTATLLAVDGAVTAGVSRQLRQLPLDTTHVVVSAGGNDALGFAHLLQAPVRSVAEALDVLSRARATFAAGYSAMLDAVIGTSGPTAVCTIYDTRLTEPSPDVIRTALALFNDCITRAAFARGVTVVDLRLVCAQDADYANPIEPSHRGGARIAAAIAAWLRHEREAEHPTVVF